MGVSFTDLPVELYYAIASYFDSEDNQAILALSRAAGPNTGFPTHLLFDRIRLRRPEQVLQLYLRLRDAPADAALVREFSFEAWKVDADVFVNLLALLPNVIRLHMNVGPTFAPEHLEQMFAKPKPLLRFLSMRFRPYVQKASYYQFLKGAYFDSTLVVLSAWPSHTLRTLSIVQDQLDSALAPTNFAQPLVFFRLDPLGQLAVSPCCRDVRFFRLRVPARQVSRHLHALPNALPSLEFLDVSTCNISSRDLESLLGHFPHVQTIILDGCPIVSQRTDVQADAGEPFAQWAELGKALALVGVARANAREKVLRTWVGTYYAHLDAQEAAPRTPRRGRSRSGRKGVATATVSLRKPAVAVPARWTATIPPARVPGRDDRVRVLPAPPALRSVAASVPGGVAADAEVARAIRAEFARGWAQGLARVSSIRLQRLTSWRNGIATIVRFAAAGSPVWEERAEHGEQGLAGLEYVTDEGEFVLDLAGRGSDGRARYECPLLCLAGPPRGDAHAEGCGHQVGWGAFGDEL
ncbi:uncharacterized protein BXZ73DRAFT_86992 [Epithele typhae]|uniref:uncharacterized protein n=1 Tax=Epithele typhae TaxID=378194 RepID=UPI002007A6E0|nr:uncharacterized protein BXZ73DRAFT_86992 [Epithele typhae]KAH9944015.1 hypothetical protein BXZ73DRAFT_86992 [Epithele typhae]